MIRRRNQAFLYGFDQQNRSRAISKVESRKGIASIFGTTEFIHNLEPNQHNHTTITQMNNCFNHFDQDPNGMLPKDALTNKLYDAESILISQLLKVLIESNNIHPFTTFYIHTTLSPYDQCCSSIQLFANHMQLPIYVTYVEAKLLKLKVIQRLDNKYIKLLAIF